MNDLFYSIPAIVLCAIEVENLILDVLLKNVYDKLKATVLNVDISHFTIRNGEVPFSDLSIPR